MDQLMPQIPEQTKSTDAESAPRLVRTNDDQTRAASRAIEKDKEQNLGETVDDKDDLRETTYKWDGSRSINRGVGVRKDRFAQFCGEKGYKWEVTPEGEQSNQTSVDAKASHYGLGWSNEETRDGWADRRTSIVSISNWSKNGFPYESADPTMQTLISTNQ